MSATLSVDAFGSIAPIPERVAPDEDGVWPEPENPLDGWIVDVALSLEPVPANLSVRVTRTSV